MNKTGRITAQDIMIITGAISVMAMLTYFFNIPNNFCFGGISGFAIAISGATGFGSPATLAAIINIVLLFLGFIFLGKSFGIKSTYASLLLSFELAMLEKFIPRFGTLTNEPLIELIFSVILNGFVSASLFNIGASSGGSDIIAMIIKKYTALNNIGKALLACDSIVIISCYFIFGIQSGMFSTMGLAVKSFMIDGVLERFNLCKYFTIITTKPAEICDYITKNLGRGATEMDAKGYFTNEDKTVIFTVLNRRQAVMLQHVVKEIDPHSFVMITNTSEVMGKGFRDIL